VLVFVRTHAGTRKRFGDESDEDEEGWGSGSGKRKSSSASKRQRTSIQVCVCMRAEVVACDGWLLAQV